MKQNDKFRDQCGVFGLYSREKEFELIRNISMGLYALQHRGQESAGIAFTKRGKIKWHKGMGLVHEVFSEEILKKLGTASPLAMGHVRYSTTGKSLLENAQPIVVQYKKGSLALAHNGNLTNARQVKSELEEAGSIFQTHTDSEVIVHLIARSKKETLLEALIESLEQIEGAYSLLLMTEQELIGIRDPRGFRPLCIGMLGDSYCLASETCALDLVGAEFLREVKPGEIVILNEKGIESYSFGTTEKISQCIFELIYLARPDSRIFDQNVYLTRKKLGRLLAQEKPIDADLVVPVPDSGIPSAIGYSEVSKIPYDMGLLRNHYIGRTFIQPGDSFRKNKVRIKLNPIPEVVQGKRIILIDDSIVRGTTAKEIIQLLRDRGAKEIHFLISSPPILHPCFYGVDTPRSKDLLASQKNIEEIRDYLGCESIHYISQESLEKATQSTQEELVNGKINGNLAYNSNFCKACFNGNYPSKIDSKKDPKKEWKKDSFKPHTAAITSTIDKKMPENALYSL